jgi:hypothetical protein
LTISSFVFGPITASIAEDIAGSNRVIVKPGDEIALKGGVKVTVVASEAKFIDKPVNGGGPNPLCADAPQMTPAAGENQRTVGVLVSYNSFTYLNVAGKPPRWVRKPACRLSAKCHILL